MHRADCRYAAEGSTDSRKVSRRPAARAGGRWKGPVGRHAVPGRNRLGPAPEAPRNRPRLRARTGRSGGTRRWSQTLAGLFRNALFSGVLWESEACGRESLPLRHASEELGKSQQQGYVAGLGETVCNPCGAPSIQSRGSQEVSSPPIGRANVRPERFKYGRIRGIKRPCSVVTAFTVLSFKEKCHGT